MTDEYLIGQTFDEAYPPEAAMWCNANNAMLIQTGTKDIEKEVQSTQTDENGIEHTTTVKQNFTVPVYSIQAIPALTDKEIAEGRIIALKQSLADSDYKVLKYTEGELSEEEWVTAKAERQSWRDEINRLQQSMHQN